MTMLTDRSRFSGRLQSGVSAAKIPNLADAQKNSTPEDWQKLVQRCTAEAESLTGSATRAALECALDLVEANSEQTVLLEVRCGVGTTTNIAASEFSGRVKEIIAIDSNQAMCSIVDGRAETLRLLNPKTAMIRSEFAEGIDLTGIPAESVDVIVCSFASLDQFQVSRVSSELARVLRPRGVLVVTSWTKAQSQFHGILASLGKYVATKEHIDVSFSSLLQKSSSVLQDEQLGTDDSKSVESLLTQMGFSSERRFDHISSTRLYTSFEDWWRALNDLSAVLGVAPAVLDHPDSALEFIRSLWPESASFQLGLAAAITIGRKPLVKK